MKIARIVGLVAAAAMALTASLGAGSAFGAETTLCKTNTESPACKSADRYAAGTAIKAEVTETLFVENPIAKVQCGESQLEAKTSAGAGAPLPVELSAWTLGKCGTTAAQNNCTVTAQEAGKAGALLWGSGANGTLSASASWHIQCTIAGFNKIDCTFGYNSSATLNGGNPAQLAVAKTTLSRTGSICPTTASLKAVNYSVSSPNPAYVAKVEEYGTQLCKVNQSPCAALNSYPEGTMLEATSENFTIETTPATFTCKTASATVKTTAGMGNPLPVELTSFVLGSCKASGVGSCSVKTSLLPPGLQPVIAWESGVNGQLNNLAASWEFTCGSGPFYIWTFEAPAMSTTLKGGSPATFGFEKAPWVYCKGALCSGGSYLTAGFTVASPKPLYVVY